MMVPIAKWFPFAKVLGNYFFAVQTIFLYSETGGTSGELVD